MEFTAHYQTYLQQMQTDYDCILRKMKREKEELELAEREIERKKAESRQNAAAIQDELLKFPQKS